MNLEYLGYVAGFCTTISFLPQAIKTIRSGDTASLSLVTYSLFTVGLILWTVYGVTVGDNSIVVANVVTTVFAAIILFSKIKNEIDAKNKN